MGFFSWTCAKTGLPIMANVPSHEEAWSKVVALYADGRTKVRGLYDGYGRIDGHEIADDMVGPQRPKLVLQAFYENEPYAAIARRSEDEPGQGYFHDRRFIAAMFDATAECAIDGHQYRERRKAFNALVEAGGDAVASRLCEPTKHARDLIYRSERVLERFQRAEDADDRARALQEYESNVRPLLTAAARGAPPLLLLHGVMGLDDVISVKATRACLAAWRANEPAAPLDWAAELALEGTLPVAPRPAAPAP